MEIEPGDIVELINNDSGLMKAEIGARALVYSKSVVNVHGNFEAFVHVVWIDERSNSQVDGRYYVGRFKKVGEDKEFKLLLSLLDEELDEFSLFRLAKNHVEKKYNRRCLNG